MDIRKQTSVNVARESVELGGALNAMGQHIFDWTPDRVGSPAHLAESSVRRLYADGRIRAEQLPMLYKKILKDFPPSVGRGGPYDTLFRIIREMNDPSTVDFAVELFERRVERGLDDDQILGLLANRVNDQRAVQTLVDLVAAYRPRQVNDSLAQLASVPANGPICFPTLASLIDVPEYSDSILGLAAAFYRYGTLPEEALPYVAAGIESREMDLVQRFMEIDAEFRDVDSIMSEQTDLIDLAETFLDVPEVEEILTYVALYGSSRLALPALIVLLDNDREVSDERLHEVAQQSTTRRELRLHLAGIGQAKLFPTSLSTIVHWAETELAERLGQHDCPVPPNDLQYIGSVEWATAPPRLVGHYLLFDVSAVPADSLRRGVGDFQQRVLAASGPHPDEPDESLTVDPWIPLPGTFVNIHDGIVDGDYETAWEHWKSHHPRRG